MTYYVCCYDDLYFELPKEFDTLEEAEIFAESLAYKFGYECVRIDVYDNQLDDYIDEIIIG